jgi:hypothetical protein
MQTAMPARVHALADWPRKQGDFPVAEVDDAACASRVHRGDRQQLGMAC